MLTPTCLRPRPSPPRNSRRVDLRKYTLIIHADDAPGVLSEVTRVIAGREANIRSIETLSSSGNVTTLLLEIETAHDVAALVEQLRALPVVRHVESAEPLMAIYGKRVIIIGGGAQVGQVAVGAISEADRHNIRGERISVDTIPLVGEEELAAAVRAVARLPRARVLVLAGALMGGTITDAVRDVQARGIIVIALNMVGSVRDAADLVVTDPLQAGVMAVMAVADTARFDISKQRRRQY
jgi:energy-converting hydrogenase B subunit Q